ncbi:MAG: hypothetical protein LBJ00_07450, partial [Planctomycetaceae bacterium]|nr:hypothetical protein [Planctomycetaceae bacterium]
LLYPLQTGRGLDHVMFNIITRSGYVKISHNYTQATLKFVELNTQSQQREAVAQGRSLPPIPATV